MSLLRSTLSAVRYTGKNWREVWDFCPPGKALLSHDPAGKEVLLLDLEKRGLSLLSTSCVVAKTKDGRLFLSDDPFILGAKEWEARGY